MTPLSNTTFTPRLELDTVSAAETELEEKYAKIELSSRKCLGDFIINYARTLLVNVALIERSEEELEPMKDHVRADIGVFFPDIQNRIKNMIWRLDGKPEEDPIESGDRNLTVDLEGTSLAIQLAGLLETISLNEKDERDDAQIDTLVAKVVDQTYLLRHSEKISGMPPVEMVEIATTRI